MMKSTATTVVKFYKDGDSMSVSTNAQSEESFIVEAVLQLSEMIESGRFKDDWAFQLERWVPQVVEVVCKLRGYKAEVYEERLIVAGTHIPAEVFSAFTRGVVGNSPEFVATKAGDLTDLGNGKSSAHLLHSKA